MSTTAPLLGGSLIEPLGGGRKWTCQECSFVNDEDLTLDDGYDSDDDDDASLATEVEPVCQLCRMFDTLKLLSGRAPRPTREEFVRAADVVLAFKMFQFRTGVSEFGFIKQVDRERERLGRFKQMFGKVVLLAHDRYGRVTTTSGLWTVPTARRRFNRTQFARLWMCIIDPIHRQDKSLLSPLRAHVHAQLAQLDLGLKSDTAKEADDSVSTLEAVKQLGRLECVELTTMFFGTKLPRIIDRINTNILYFDTLMMHIEVNTFSSDVNGTISPEEFWEGLHLLGVPDEYHKAAMLHFHDFSHATGRTSLTGSLFRILCLHLCSPSAATMQGNITDMLAGADRRRKAKRRRPGTSAAPAPSTVRGRVGGSVGAGAPPSVGGSGSGGHRVELLPVAAGSVGAGGVAEAKAHSVISEATGITELTMLDEPAQDTRKVNWHMSASEMNALRKQSLSLTLVREFRQRLQFLFSSAEGNVRHISWGSFWITFLQLLVLPIGLANMLYTRTKRVGFNFYYIIGWLLGVAYWFAIVIPIITYVMWGCECITLFEIFYPGATAFLAVFAVSTFNGFYGVVLHPSTFRRLRLKYRLSGISATYHFFETGAEKHMPVLEIMSNEHILPASDPSLLGNQEAFAKAFSPKMRKTMDTVSIIASLVVAFLPGVLRSVPSDVFQTEQCRNFFGYTALHAGVSQSDLTLHSMTAVCYAIVAFGQTYFFSLFLRRLYVAYARIARCFSKFTAVVDRMDARKKRVGALVSFNDEESEGITSGGRLSGYMDLRHPRNVKAWSKMRVYMIQNFADQLGASEVFLAFFVLFGVIVALFCVLFVVIPPEALDSVDSQPGHILQPWQWKLMAFLCGIVAAIIMIPVFLVLGYGVDINDSLAKHRPYLLKTKYLLIEEVHSIQESHMQIDGGVGLVHGPKVARLQTARRMVSDLLDIISFKDVQITILGVAITSTLIRTVFSSIAVAAASSLAKVLSSAAKKVE